MTVAIFDCRLFGPALVSTALIRFRSLFTMLVGHDTTNPKLNKLKRRTILMINIFIYGTDVIVEHHFC